MSAMDRPASLASRRASGLLKMRDPLPSAVPPEVDEADIEEVAVDVADIEEAAMGEATSDPASADPTPSWDRRAPRSSTCSPGSPRSAIGAPTSTRAPADTSVLRMTPSASAGTSTTAFSVSTVAMVSADLKRMFSGIGHPDSTASVALAATSGMRSNRAMSGRRDLGQAGDDFFALGDRRPFQDLADTGRGLSARDSLHGLVEPVEEPSLDLVGEPAAVRRPEGTLLGDQHVVGLPDAGADGVPVDTCAVEPAQVDHLGVDVAELSHRFEHLPDHRKVGDHRDL